MAAFDTQMRYCGRFRLPDEFDRWRQTNPFHVWEGGNSLQWYEHTTLVLPDGDLVYAAEGAAWRDWDTQQLAAMRAIQWLQNGLHYAATYALIEISYRSLNRTVHAVSKPRQITGE